MKTILKAVALTAAIATVPTAAFAQKAPGAVIVTVDTRRISAECNACKTAATQLQSQAQQLQQFAQGLGQPIQTEADAIQKALAGKAPDAAMQTRIQALQTKQNQANQQLQQREQTLRRNQAYVSQQINDKLRPILTQVMNARGANLVVDRGDVLDASSTLDVTTDVLTQLNTALPSVSTTAPAQAAPASR
ncbi:hypothetical protein ACFB49_18490 [Sphingomonas sp. DBB INV C78]|uniref:OmpH family outer membrane protein n=1 Tax=Sphingomonas sp. DBB INV C78 TaxID=3349434 RepID=UPI0036D2AFA4